MSNQSEMHLYNNYFSHIYIEEDAKKYPISGKLIKHFNGAEVINIDHYKDVFCRSHQSFASQKNCPSLILAVKKENLIYEGSPMCDDFGNDNFYYTSSMMNCVYNCEYCYLQGMYPSSNILVFVNLEDIFSEVEKLLKKHSVYLCISYDTDILALENILGYGHKWLEFAALHDNLKLELRTKSTGFNAINDIKPLDNVILAITLSPDKITRLYEHRTPPLEKRLLCAKNAIEKGWHIRLCLDPLLYLKEFKGVYGNFVSEIFKMIPADKVYDISIGVFRVSKNYLKLMRHNNESSALLSYPFETKDGISTYNEKLADEMISYASSEVAKYISSDKIYY